MHTLAKGCTRPLQHEWLEILEAFRQLRLGAHAASSAGACSATASLRLAALAQRMSVLLLWRIESSLSDNGMVSNALDSMPSCTRSTLLKSSRMTSDACAI